ncbi:hypothetical protein [Rhizobium lusitanum]|uniref:Uncharacterized protein n=1 Tax=Rhizobium lusitanum TaxID=293958 RepID=A0A7X0IYW5_9HYPH|nr:hypothetical protein [Rhizobium lusitanum]MBB6489147.1 hypothetical protein [Rhizobium lusitanum]
MGFTQKSRKICLKNHRIGFVASAIFAVVASISSPMSANSAEATHAKNKTVQLYMKKYEKNNVVFYSGNSISKTTTVSSEDYFKGSPYICTPSGFGQTSHCRNRSLF